MTKPNISSRILPDFVRRQSRRNILLCLTALGALTGVLFGFTLRATTDFKPPVKNYFGTPGYLFIRALKFLILPLITTNIITAIGGLSTQKTGKIAIRTFLFYLTTTFSAVIVGLVLVTTIRPGELGKNAFETNTPKPFIFKRATIIDNFVYILKNLIPENMIEMGFEVLETKILPRYKTVYNYSNITNENKSIRVIDYYEPVDDRKRGINVLGLVLFSLTFGAMLAKVGPKGHTVLEFFEGLNAVFAKIMQLVMTCSPLAICSLVCRIILEMEDPKVVFRGLSYYMLTVLLGLAVQGLIVLPVVYVIVTGKSIFQFAKNMYRALISAFGSASSAATLPVTYKCIEERNKISKLVSRFVLPVGATVNLDGTALYEAVASIFIAQISEIELTLLDLILTSLTATLATMGAAGIPSAGLVTLLVVLSALNIPASQITLIFAVDWILDRFRTMINVWGDAVATACVAHLSKKEIEQYEKNLSSKNMPSISSDFYQLNEIFDQKYPF
ncbi:excitatory amino acid transporter 3 [Brachionus plicatilis]|uniref:Amino acid transporter n=1 Tax=Brachionus plicatilis TaxID=10195 RepID=A0A3M7RX46_BRAPC|nr:excitatory amino acid transporter 3 [Brachionus plicatilis]